MINKVIQKSESQVLVIENKNEFNTGRRKIKKTDLTGLESLWGSYSISFSSIGVTTIVCLMLRAFIEAPNIPMIFIIPILLTSLVAGKNQVFWHQYLLLQLFDLFFVSPFYSFSVMMFVSFLLYCIIGSRNSYEFTYRYCQKQVEYIRQRETFISSLYDFSKGLLASQDLSLYGKNYKIIQILLIMLSCSLPDESRNCI